MSVCQVILYKFHEDNSESQAYHLTVMAASFNQSTNVSYLDSFIKHCVCECGPPHDPHRPQLGSMELGAFLQKRA